MVCRINGTSGDGFDKELYLRAQEALRAQGKTTPTSADIKAAMDKLKAEDNTGEKPIKGFNLERSGETFVDFDEVQMMPTMITKSVSYLGKEEGEMKPLPSVVGQEEGEMVPLPSELGKEGGIALPKPNKPQITEDQLERIKELLDQINDILNEKPETEFQLPEGDEWQKILDKLKFKEGIRDQVTTNAMGEEGGDADNKDDWNRILEKFREGRETSITTTALGEEGGSIGTTKSMGEEGGEYTTLALNEEGGSAETTKAMGEEGGGNHATTMALGEEGGSDITTLALGEEGGDAGVTTNTLGEEGGEFATTKAMGEEGGDAGITTKAIGEEGGIYQPSNPTLDLDELIEKLKKKYPELFAKRLTEADVRKIIERFQPQDNQFGIY